MDQPDESSTLSGELNAMTLEETQDTTAAAATSKKEKNKNKDAGAIGGESDTIHVKQKEREDPLANWTPPPKEECPICLIALPILPGDTEYRHCCGKTICCGCELSLLEASLWGLKRSICSFCRHDRDVSNLLSDAEWDEWAVEREMKRANAGGATAMGRVGQYYFDGQFGVQQDKAEGLKWYHRDRSRQWNGSC